MSNELVVLVQRALERYLLDVAGLVGGEGQDGAVTLIQRFGSAANLNVHLHCLVLEVRAAMRSA